MPAFHLVGFRRVGLSYRLSSHLTAFFSCYTPEDLANKDFS